jgi:hypothetical protein
MDDPSDVCACGCQQALGKEFRPHPEPAIKRLIELMDATDRGVGSCCPNVPRAVLDTVPMLIDNVYARAITA